MRSESIVGVLLVVALFGLRALPAEAAEAPAVESSHETAEAEVKRVFAAEEGDHRFVAYLVEWNGQEVIVDDPLSRSDYKAGDTIRFLVHRGRLRGPEAGESIAPLSFILSPRPRQREMVTPAEERRHMRIVQGDLDAAQSETERFYALGDAAKNALEAGEADKARKLALELEKMIPSYQRDWNYGNAIQESNQVLGRIALSEGDVDEAKRRLLASADSKGSPQMNSFGPNMTLAKELLEKGETEAVLPYFDRCGKFWSMGKEKLSTWASQVEAGRTPDFGANLKY